MARWLILAATFTSAFLLFLIQPLLAKYLLPYFGGTSSVWTISVFFYSAVLLLGYLYAAVITRIKLQFAGLIHGVLLVSVLGLFAVRLVNGVPPVLMPAMHGPTPALSVLLTLLVAVGLPVLLLASTSVLTQMLYARATNANPYPLYALSNLGSLSALVAYPFFIEPFSPLTVQSVWWVMGFILFACVMLLGWYLSDLRRPVSASLEPESNRPATFSYRTVLLYAAIPTFFLTSVTELMSKGVASFPLLWVIPLVLFLLSFVVAFRDKVRRIPLPFVLAAVFAALLVAPWFSKSPWYYWSGFIVMSVAFFTIIVYLHRELYERRPAVSSLGSFYVVMTAGGAIGSGVVGLLLPLILNDYHELYVLLIGLNIWILGTIITRYVPQKVQLYRRFVLGLGGVVAAVLLVTYVYPVDGRVALDRNFYGSLKVLDVTRTLNDETVPVRVIVSGATYHGQEVLDERYSSVATSYYGEKSGVDLAIATLREQGITPRLAVIGLGAGMMNLYCDKVAQIDYVEINPMVETFAREYFSYLSQCEEKTSVTIADGRLHLETLAQSGVRDRYDIIMVDAFTDDAIPTHLLTFEALGAAYAPLLSEQGIVVFHISNRYLNLVPPIAGMAEAAGFQAVRYFNSPEAGTLNFPTAWVLITAPKYTARLYSQPGANLYTGNSPMITWTDEQSSVLPILSLTGSF